MKILILILCLTLSSCASVKINSKVCKSQYECTTISYWSKKDHPEGVEAKVGDMEFSSKSSVSKDSALEQAGAMALLKLIDQVKIK